MPSPCFHRLTLVFETETTPSHPLRAPYLRDALTGSLSTLNQHIHILRFFLHHDTARFGRLGRRLGRLHAVLETHGQKRRRAVDAAHCRHVCVEILSHTHTHALNMPQMRLLSQGTKNEPTPAVWRTNNDRQDTNEDLIRLKVELDTRTCGAREQHAHV